MPLWELQEGAGRGGMNTHWMGLKVVIFFWVCLPLVLRGRGVSDPFSEMAEELSVKTSSREVSQIAVMEFEMVNSQGGVGGRVVQDRLIAAFVNKGVVPVVERERLDAIKKELTLGMTGLLDETTTKRIGKILGVDGLVLGSLLDLGEGNFEANARLVVVETGEILGVVTKSVKKTWVESSPTEPALSRAVFLKEWQIPTNVEPNLSAPSQSGVIIYRSTQPFVDSEPRILQINLVDDTLASATFDVEYYLPPLFQGATVHAKLLLSSEDQLLSVGRNVVRFHWVLETWDYFWATSSVAFEFYNRTSAWDSQVLYLKCPFRKIWIKSTQSLGFTLNRIPTMKIAQIAPPTLRWDKSFTLYGEFFRERPQVTGVIVAGTGLYRFLEIRDWRKDRIVVEPLCSGRSAANRSSIDPDLPYILYVVAAYEHSGLFLVNFDPNSKGFPKK